MSELIVIIGRIKFGYSNGRRRVYFSRIHPGPPEPENHMSFCPKHGKVIFFAAGTECPACKQIEGLKFADV